MKNEHTLTTAAKLRQYKNHTATTPDGSKVVDSGRNIFDLFTGDGWKRHSRYRRVGDRFIYISGRTLSDQWFAENTTNGS